MNDNIARKMQQTYNIAYWGGGYYLANNRGNISVCPNPDVPDATFDLTELVKRVQEEQSNLRLPALFAFLKFYSIAYVRLMRRFIVHVNLMVIKVTTF